MPYISKVYKVTLCLKCELIKLLRERVALDMHLGLRVFCQVNISITNNIEELEDWWKIEVARTYTNIYIYTREFQAGTWNHGLDCSCEEIHSGRVLVEVANWN